MADSNQQFEDRQAMLSRLAGRTPYPSDSPPVKGSSSPGSPGLGGAIKDFVNAVIAKPAENTGSPVNETRRNQQIRQSGG